MALGADVGHPLTRGELDAPLVLEALSAQSCAAQCPLSHLSSVVAACALGEGRSTRACRAIADRWRVHHRTPALAEVQRSMVPKSSRTRKCSCGKVYPRGRRATPGRAASDGSERTAHRVARDPVARPPDAPLGVHAGQEERPEGEEDEQRQDRGPVGAGQLEHQVEHEAAEPRRAALEGLVEAEVLALAAGRDEQAEERPGQRLGAAHDQPDQHGEAEEQQRPLGRQEEADGDDTHPGQHARPGSPAGTPCRCASLPKSSAPATATNCTSRMVAMSTVGLQAELALAVHRGGADDGLDAVVVEEVGQQERQRHRVVAHVAEGVGELAEAAPHQRALDGDLGRRRPVLEAAGTG